MITEISTIKLNEAIIQSPFPTKSQIERVANSIFSEKKSCLETTLLNEEAKKYIKDQTLKIDEIQKRIDLDQIKPVLVEIKKIAQEQVKPLIKDYDKKLSINKGSLVFFPERSYLMTSMPKSPEDIKWFWKSMIDFNSNKAVAAIMPEEKNADSNHALDYCKDDHYPLQIDAEREIKLLKTKVIAKSKDVPNCEIIKRVFKVCSGKEERIIKHYHYQGWKNKKGAPDSDLLALILKKINKKVQNDTVTVHCAAGRGRSGNVVLADIFQKRLEKEPKVLNIFEPIIHARTMRDGFIETPEQITSAFNTAREIFNTPKYG